MVAEMSSLRLHLYNWAGQHCSTVDLGELCEVEAGNEIRCVYVTEDDVLHAAIGPGVTVTSLHALRVILHSKYHCVVEPVLLTGV